ncbi:hypothetical protein CMO91_02540 [Candidatus Woesearchaeota archaeon]|nr:hypothetical protein [Candidatus Woesearchaeota archaeon]
MRWPGRERVLLMGVGKSCEESLSGLGTQRQEAIKKIRKGDTCTIVAGPVEVSARYIRLTNKRRPFPFVDVRVDTDSGDLEKKAVRAIHRKGWRKGVRNGKINTDVWTLNVVASQPLYLSPKQRLYFS